MRNKYLPVLLLPLFTLIHSIEAKVFIPEGQPLVGEPVTEFLEPLGDTDRFEITFNSEGGPNGSGSWTVETLLNTSPPWSIGWHAPLKVAVAAGDTALLKVTARALRTTHETGEAQFRFSVQNRGGAFVQDAVAQHFIGSEWQTFYLPVRFSRDFEAGGMRITFGFGYVEQAIELADIQAIYFGSDIEFEDLPVTRITYFGRDPDAQWRKDALERIEKIRKGDIQISVVDRSGQPIAGAELELVQTNSAFEFGTCIHPGLLLSDGSDGERYRQKLLKLFNAGGPENDLKWPFWAGERTGDIQQRAIETLKWMREHNMSTRGHVFVWPGQRFLPKYITDLVGTEDESKIPGLVLDHIKDITAATEGLIDEWDVINEPFNNHLLMDIFGDEIMVDWFKAAREQLPGIPLYINDWGTHDIDSDPYHVQHFVDTTQFLLENGAEVNGLGLQGHVGANAMAPPSLIKTLDFYEEKLGLDVRVTEFDITTDDLELQADFTRDFMIALFSHPTVVGVQLWGFWEDAHWSPRAALYRSDWSEKPNGKVFRELVTETWRTDKKIRSDAEGNATIRGFHGDYQLRVKVGDTESMVEFVHPGESTTIHVVFP